MRKIFSIVSCLLLNIVLFAPAGGAEESSAIRDPSSAVAQTGAERDAKTQPAGEPPKAADPLAEAERIPVNITLNTVNQGDHIIAMTPEEDVLVPSPALARLFREVPAGVQIEGEPHVSLRSLAPDVKFEFDLDTLTVHITADPKLLKPTALGIARKEGEINLITGQNSAYINYGIGYQLGNEGEFVGLSLPWEVAVRTAGTAAFSSFSTSRFRTEDGIEEDSVRLISNLTWDFPEDRITLIAGDIDATSGALGSSGNFGGVSFSKNFALTPTFVTFPKLGLAGIAETPSQVDIYVNGILVSSRQLPPGEFTIDDVPNARGSGEAEMVITDAFGRETRTKIPFFISTSLLKPGLQEFSYNLGYHRRGLGEDSARYGEPAFLGFHRFGIFKTFTAGFRAEAGKNDSTGDEVINAGVSADLVLGRIGVSGMALAFSREEGEDEPLTGRSVLFRHRFATSLFAISFSGQSTTRGYSTLSVTAASADKTARSWSAGAGMGFGFAGSVSGTISNEVSFTGEEKNTLRGSYRLSLGALGALAFSGSKTNTIDVEGRESESNQVTATYSIRFAGHSASYSQREDADSISRSITISRNAPSSIGWSYQYNGQETERKTGGGSASNTGNVRYVGPRGIYSARHSVSQSVNQSGSSETRSTSLNIAGGFSWIAGAFHHSRPIRDGFALVRTSGLEGVRVYLSNSEFGASDSNGELLLPGLGSYRNNKIALEEQDIPIEYDIAEIEKQIAPPFRGGVLVAFDLRKIQAFTGSLYFIVKGVKIPAEFAGLNFEADGKPLEFLIGLGGEFYFENVSPGVYPARLFRKEMECRFDLVIPETDETFVDLGEVNCEIN